MMLSRKIRRWSPFMLIEIKKSHTPGEDVVILTFKTLSGCKHQESYTLSIDEVEKLACTLHQFTTDEVDLGDVSQLLCRLN